MATLARDSDEFQKRRPNSMVNKHKRALDIVPKINANKEDILLYKMLRLTDSYV